jgi:hypothetical protein
MALYTNPRFRGAIERALDDWALADPGRCAELAGCVTTADGVLVPFFGTHYLVSHPDGRVAPAPRADGDVEGRARAAAGAAGPGTVHVSIAILLLHYLLTADGAPEVGRWVTFRELPDGLFYAQAFAAHAEAALAAVVAAGAGDGGVDGRIRRFCERGARLGGVSVDLADEALRFRALPRVPVAVLLWKGDDEFPGQAGILFDASAHHYVPTEDRAGMGDWLAHQLVRGGKGGGGESRS